MLYKTKLEVQNSNLNNDDQIEKEREILSIQEIIQDFRKMEFNNAVFTLQKKDPIYFQIKMTKFTRNSQEKVMLQLIDISSTILYD